MASYNSTDTSESLFSRAARVSPGGVHSPVRAFKSVGLTPRFVAKAEGATITDVEGRSYIDYCMAWGPMIFGHQDPEIKEAVTKALERGWSYGAAEPYSLELAETIVKNIPWVEKVRFVSSGTEAVMSALRLARAATGRDKVIKFNGCYHGHVDSMLVKAGSGLADMASPDSAGVAKHVAADTIVVELGDIEGVRKTLAAYPKQIAAAIIEPLPANNGLLIQEASFLKEMQAELKAAGVLLILDEVISGFRIGFSGIAGELGLTPDLVTYGKVIGGGFPVGAFGGRSDLMDLIAPLGPVYQAGTMSANPVAMSAGVATLNKLLRDNPYEALGRETKKLGQAVLAHAKRSADIPVNVQSHGSIFWMALGKSPSNESVIRRIDNIPATQKSLFATLFSKLLERGLYLAPSGFEVGFMSTAHSREHNEKLGTAIGECLAEMSTEQKS